MSAWMQTSTGRELVFYEPDVGPGHLFTEIAVALARAPRFNGHTVDFYSVAQHSVICAEAAEDETGDRELAAYCLLHDARIGLFGQISGPMKSAIAEELSAHVDRSTARLVGEARSTHFLQSVNRIEERLTSAIAYAAGLDIEGLMQHRAAVVEIHLRALRTERDDLMLDGARRWEGGVERAARLPVRGGRIVPLPELRALALFAETLQRLCPATAAASPTRWTA